MFRKISFFVKITLVVSLFTILIWGIDSYTTVDISDESQSYLKDLGIDKYEVTKIGKVTQIKSTYREGITVSDEEVDKVVDDELSVAGKFVEITDRDIVKEGDFVEVSYYVYLNNELVNEAKNEILKVGAGYYGKEFEKN